MSENRISYRDGYNLWCQDYDLFDNPLIALSDDALREAPLRLQGRDVLDLGCGTGRNCAYALGEGADSVTGIDGSEGMLKVAKERLRGNTDRSTFVEGDISSPLPFPHLSFDVVIISLVLEHLELIAPIIAECARVLRPHGEIFIAEIHPDLISKGTGAHFLHNDTVYTLPSFPHKEGDFVSAFSASALSVSRCTSFYASGAAAQRIPKLTKHLGTPVLLSLLGQKLA